MKPLVQFCSIALLLSGCVSDSLVNQKAFRHSPPEMTVEDSSAHTFPGAQWESISNPEKYGFSAERLKEAKKFFQTTDADSVMVVKSGRVLLDMGNPALVSNLHSARKAVLALMYGKYVAAGKINPKSTMADLGIDDVGGLVGEEKNATVEQLLMSRSGVYHVASMGGSHTLPPRGSAKPGEKWIYNNWDFNAAGTVFEKLTGRDIFEAFRQDLAGPLQMEDFDLKNQRKTGSREKSIHPGYMLRLSTRDMARIGYLMLNKGQWKGSALYPEEWVSKISSTVTPADEFEHPGLKKLQVGFGLCWWTVHKFPTRHPELMEGAFFANGAFGQNILVIPKADLVLVTKVDSGYFGYQLMDDLPMETLIEMSDRVLDARI